MSGINRAIRRAFFGHNKETEKKALAGCKQTAIKNVRGVSIKITLDITISNLEDAIYFFDTYASLIANYMEWSAVGLGNILIFAFDAEEFATKTAKQRFINENKQMLIDEVMEHIRFFAEVHGAEVSYVDLEVVNTK